MPKAQKEYLYLCGREKSILSIGIYVDTLNWPQYREYTEK